MERRRCNTIPQQTLLVEFMETHRSLVHSITRGKEARAAREQLWVECAKQLNAKGPARTAKEWSKVWNDFKCKVKMKIVNAKLHGEPGNRPNTSTVALSPLETRVANILAKSSQCLNVCTSYQSEQQAIKLDDDITNDFVMYIQEEPPTQDTTDLLHTDADTQETDQSEEQAESPALSERLLQETSTPTMSHRSLSSNSEDGSQHWNDNASTSSPFQIYKKNTNNLTADSKIQSCPDCDNIKINIEKFDKRNDVFGQLIAEELIHIKPCLRSRTYARILKFLDEAKGHHSVEIKFEAQD